MATDGNNIETWLNNISQKIDVIAKNRVIVAGGLLFQGISMLLNPENVAKGIVQGIGTTMIISSVVYLITTLIIEKKKLPAKTIGITVLIALLGVAYNVWPDTFVPFLRFELGIFLFLTGGTALARKLQLNRLARYGDKLLRDDDTASSLPPKDVANEVDHSLDEQVTNNVAPALRLLSRMNGSSLGSWISNGLIFMMGLTIMLYPMDTDSDTFFLISGIALTLTGLADLWTALSLEWKKRARGKTAVETPKEAEKADLPEEKGKAPSESAGKDEK